jgi:hypothetical protein
MTTTYDVGSVLWIIHTDRPGLMAYRVVEEITKKTLEGEQIQYLVQAAMPKSKIVKLESIKGQIFEESEEAKMRLIENATKAIDGMVVKIQKNVDKFFNNKKEEQESVQETIPKIQSISGELKPGYQWVTMEDGTKAQIKIPEIMK